MERDGQGSGLPAPQADVLVSMPGIETVLASGFVAAGDLSVYPTLAGWLQARDVGIEF